MDLYLSIAWGVLYLVCAALGVFGAPGWVGILACLLFFVPPALILYRAQDAKPVRVVRSLSVLWLAVTVVLLILNILSVAMSELAGTVLYYLLAVLTVPMVCGGYWLIALFLWACLLMASLRKLRRMK